MNEESFTLRQASKALGTEPRALRRLCDRGLIRGVRRARNGYRILDNQQVEQAKTLLELQKCGMNWNELKAYRQLEGLGEKSIPERRAILDTKRRQLWLRLVELQKSIDFIERKEELFEQALKNEKEA